MELSNNILNISFRCIFTKMIDTTEINTGDLWQFVPVPPTVLCPATPMDMLDKFCELLAYSFSCMAAAYFSYNEYNQRLLITTNKYGPKNITLLLNKVSNIYPCCWKSLKNISRGVEGNNNPSINNRGNKTRKMKTWRNKGYRTSPI